MEEFYNNRTKKDGKESQCKKCVSVYNKSENRKEQYKKYTHSEKGIKRRKKYELTENRKEYKKNYRLTEQQKINKLKQTKKRYNTDPLFKTSKLIRRMIAKSFKSGKYQKTYLIESTENMLGCTFEYVKNYIEEKFEPWMSWDNHGKYNGKEKYGWDIDHIIPLSSAKTKEDLIKLFHYTNLQPLDSYINRDIKKDKIEHNK